MADLGADRPEDAQVSRAPRGSALGGPRISPRGWKRILAATWKDAGENNVSLVAAGVAFYAFLAFVPLLTAFVLSYGLFAEPASVVRHMRALTSVVPQDAARVIGDQLQSMAETSGAQTGFALVVAIGMALYGASRGAGSVIAALNIVYEVGESRTFVRRLLVTGAMSSGAVIALFLAILAVAAFNWLEAWLPDLAGVGQALLKTGFFLLAGAAVMLLLAIVYRFGPNRPEAPRRWMTAGALLATIVWLAATAGFGVYVANFGSFNATYGSLGAVIVFLTWLYLTAYIALLGAELNAVLEAQTGKASGREASALVPELVPTKRQSPSLAAVVARLGLFRALLAVLRRRRRA